jgi:hypothetical protein
MKCRRTACDSTHNIICRHTQTGDLYCPRCARAINDYTPGLVDWPPVDRLWVFREVRDWRRDGDTYAGTMPDGSVVEVPRTPAR